MMLALKKTCYVWETDRARTWETVGKDECSQSTAESTEEGPPKSTWGKQGTRSLLRLWFLECVLKSESRHQRAELELAYHSLKIVLSAAFAHLLLIFSSTAWEGWNDGHCWPNANLANQVTLGFPVAVIDGIVCSLGLVSPIFWVYFLTSKA